MVDCESNSEIIVRPILHKLLKGIREADSVNRNKITIYNIVGLIILRGLRIINHIGNNNNFIRDIIYFSVVINRKMTLG